MKILWVKPGKLLPLDSGGKLRTYNLLRCLSTTHDVTYLCYHEGPRDEAYEAELASHLYGAVCVPDSYRVDGGSLQSANYLLGTMSRVPYSVRKFTSTRVQRILKEWLSQHRFDVAVCDFLASTQNFPATLSIPTVLFQHNVETLLWQRRAEHERNRVNRWAARFEHAKMARYEPRQVRRFHHVLAVSREDRAAMNAFVMPESLSVLPTGVDLSKYRFDPNFQARAPLVVFTGSMDWAPNIDAAEYFCREIWPLVLSQIPDARFRIVGRNPDRRVQALADSSVEVTGTVPSVVEHLWQAAVLVVPLRAGGGTRIKIYEGMAMGRATVSTRVGAEGLDVHHGHDILLADEPGEFAAQIIMLLRDKVTRRKYEAAAAAAVQKYDWSVIAHQLAEILKRCVESHRSGRDRKQISAPAA